MCNKSFSSSQSFTNLLPQQRIVFIFFYFLHIFLRSSHSRVLSLLVFYMYPSLFGPSSWSLCVLNFHLVIYSIIPSSATARQQSAYYFNIFEVYITNIQMGVNTPQTNPVDLPLQTSTVSRTKNKRAYKTIRARETL